MEHTLVLNFLNAAGEKTSITVSGVKPDITKDQISTLMDTILAKNIFLSKGGALVSKSGAQVSEKTVTKFDF